MIDLFAHDELAALGLQAILDLERIPYRRIGTPEESSASLLVVAGDGLTTSEAAVVERVPSLVLGGGEPFAIHAFGADSPRIDFGRCTIGLDQAIWPAHVVNVVRTHGKRELRLPAVPFCRTSDLTKGMVLATLTTPGLGSGLATQPAVARRNRCLWSLLDLGTAFANLMAEEDGTPRPRDHAASPFHNTLRRVAEMAYYAAPMALRRWVQRRTYATLDRRLAAARDVASEYPIDATGYLLIELVKQLIKVAAGSLVRVARWPAPYQAAASLTHDIEPRRFAYTRGIDRLLDDRRGHRASGDARTGRRNRRAAISPTTRSGASRPVRCSATVSSIAASPCGVGPASSKRSSTRASASKGVSGGRSSAIGAHASIAPRISSGRSIASGFRYDSSLPDVDRENMANFGRGVRLNVPFRPLIDDEAGTRPSRCLELPLTAPDCIQPLFAGESSERLRQTVESKAAFLGATGGLYVALVHGGVFDEHDADVRTAHLEFVYRQLRRADVWLAGMEDIADWWCRREIAAADRQGERGSRQQHRHPTHRRRARDHRARWRRVRPQRAAAARRSADRARHPAEPRASGCLTIGDRTTLRVRLR